MRDCVVVGAGPAGLGVAAMLERASVPTVVLDRADRIASSWHGRYDGFRLNTSSWFSHLPGRRLPRDAGRWPSRDALVAYYEDYARRHDLDVRLRSAVDRIERANEGWNVLTPDTSIAASYVVVATGKYNTPVVPDWPGRETSPVELRHSSSYRNADPYRGRKVLVVGPGASGFEIATQVARGGAAGSWLSIRTPPHIVHRNIGPFPSDLFAVLARPLPISLVDRLGELIRRVSVGDLAPYGLGPPPDGIYTRVATTGMIPTVDGPYVRAIKERIIEVVPAVERFDDAHVVLSDGRRLTPDVVIAATGYRRNLEPLVGHLGMLQPDGHPRVHGGLAAPEAPHLYFTGFTEPFSGNLRELRLDAKRIAQAISRSRRQTRRALGDGPSNTAQSGI